jgi:uncharacterized glyoxalase superfamily protein PhnB
MRHSAQDLPYKRIAVGMVVSGAIMGSIYMASSSSQNQPVSLSDDLSHATADARRQAASQMTVTIKNMPSAVDADIAGSIQNQLAVLLRYKYGRTAARITAVVRQSMGYDSSGRYSMYIDVPDENETYVVYADMQTQTTSIQCAPQHQQIDPDWSHCTDPPTVDIANRLFPEG